MIWSILDTGVPLSMCYPLNMLDVKNMALAQCLNMLFLLNVEFVAGSFNGTF